MCLFNLPSSGAYGECAPASSLVGVEPSAPVPEDTWAFRPSTSEAFGTFYVPRELRLLMNAEFEGGQPTGYAMGAISAAFHTGPI